MARTTQITSVIGSVSARAPIPARTNTRMISSEAYADEEMLSEAKIARPGSFPTRSSPSSNVARGRPMSARLSRPSPVARGPCDSTTSSRGTSRPPRVRRKWGWSLNRRY
jgi:hypothetical protein